MYLLTNLTASTNVSSIHNSHSTDWLMPFVRRLASPCCTLGYAWYRMSISLIVNYRFNVRLSISMFISTAGGFLDGITHIDNVCNSARDNIGNLSRIQPLFLGLFKGMLLALEREIFRF